MPTPVIEHISDTARWVATYRAMESERPDALFRDPLARRLGGERGQQIVRTMAGASTSGWVIAVRTAVLDEFIMRGIEEGVDLVLNLAAGFDARPYRLALPSTLTWVEVDFPGVIEEKTKLLEGETPRCRLERITADLSDAEARRAVFSRVGAQCRKAMVLTEGLLMYLGEQEKEQLCGIIREVLKERGGVWITADIYIKRQMEQYNARMETREKNFFQRHNVEENKFDSFESAEAFFSKQGFVVEKEAVFDRAKITSLRELGKLIPWWRMLLYAIGIGKFPKIQATWQLRPVE